MAPTNRATPPTAHCSPSKLKSRRTPPRKTQRETRAGRQASEATKGAQHKQSQPPPFATATAPPARGGRGRAGEGGRRERLSGRACQWPQQRGAAALFTLITAWHLLKGAAAADGEDASPGRDGERGQCEASKGGRPLLVTHSSLTTEVSSAPQQRSFCISCGEEWGQAC